MCGLRGIADATQGLRIDRGSQDGELYEIMSTVILQTHARAEMRELNQPERFRFDNDFQINVDLSEGLNEVDGLQEGRLAMCLQTVGVLSTVTLATQTEGLFRSLVLQISFIRSFRATFCAS